MSTFTFTPSLSENVMNPMNHHHNFGTNVFHGEAGKNVNMNTSLVPNVSTTTPYDSNGSIPFPDVEIVPLPCQWILYEDIANSRVRIWDVLILVPNALFLVFLIWNFLTLAAAKLRNTNSPIFTAFYLLVCVVAVISVLRCVVSMTVNASVKAGDIADKVLWLILKFFLLATELSVVTFGLAFGHLDSKTSIRRVLLVTSLISLIYSSTQGTLEFVNPDPKFHVSKSGNSTSQNYDIFGHGGMIFWMTSSAFFFLVYTCIFILPWTRLKAKLNLPSRKSFYLYAALLSILNITQMVGSVLIYTGNLHGMCVVDTTTYLYFTCFAPLVYGTFLRDFFRASQPSILFSYKQQTDESADVDSVHLPYQAPAELPEEEGSMDGSLDSTHFDRQYMFHNGNLGNTDVSVQGRLSINSDYYQNSA